ncbi:PilN domain-containing protein [Patescibacteria group bacterium]
MPAKKKYTSVNLLSKDAFSESFVGKALMWALSIGRYIVVLTELVVILSFLSRFKLDRDLTDLNSRINQQLLVIESYGDLEPKFRALQNKLAFVRKTSEDVDVENVMDQLIGFLPPDVRLSEISIRQDRVVLSAVSLNSRGFADYINSIRSNPQFKNIDLNNITSDEGSDVGVMFDISIDLSGGKR